MAVYLHSTRNAARNTGNSTEAVNSSDGESETGDIPAAAKLAGKHQNGRLLDLTARRSCAASEESRPVKPSSKCPCGGFAGFLSEGEPHCSLWIDYDVHHDTASVVITSV